MDASTEFNKEQTIPDNKITTIINIKFSVANNWGNSIYYGICDALDNTQLNLTYLGAGVKIKGSSILKLASTATIIF
jgi:hypothetical protein